MKFNDPVSADINIIALMPMRQADNWEGTNAGQQQQPRRVHIMLAIEGARDACIRGEVGQWWLGRSSAAPLKAAAVASHGSD